MQEPGSTQLTRPLPVISPTANFFNVQTILVLGRNTTVLRDPLIKGISSTCPVGGLASSLDASLSMIETIQRTRSLPDPGGVSVKLEPLPWILSIVTLELSRTRPREQLGSLDSCSCFRTSLRRVGMGECGKITDSEVMWLRRAAF